MDETKPTARRKPRLNRLNDLSAKEWLRFQKSWFVHNPPRRQRSVLAHPAKFPETLAQEFIEFFTKRGQLVLDPMVGTGSTLVACMRCGRRGIGIEVNEKYARIAKGILEEERARHNGYGAAAEQLLIVADARNLLQMHLPQVDYCLTSPPYWDMLRMPGAQTQKKRRQSEELDVYYSDSPADLGNISDYDQFILALTQIYRQVYEVLKNGGYLTVIVKNVKKGGRMFPLAWDLARQLGQFFVLKDEKIWCQDNQRLAPYGYLNAWVSNTFHHYCLNFRKEEPEPAAS